MARLQALTAVTRPHLEDDCWCGPSTCECCGEPSHRFTDIRPDVQPRMAVFSDQRISAIP